MPLGPRVWFWKIHTLGLHTTQACTRFLPVPTSVTTVSVVKIGLSYLLQPWRTQIFVQFYGVNACSHIDACRPIWQVQHWFHYTKYIGKIPPKPTSDFHACIAIVNLPPLLWPQRIKYFFVFVTLVYIDTLNLGKTLGNFDYINENTCYSLEQRPTTILLQLAHMENYGKPRG